MTAIGDYTLLRTLGVGGFSKVYLAEHNESKEIFALKICVNKKKLLNYSELVSDEILLTKSLDHPNIIKCYDYSLSQKYVSTSGKETTVMFMALELAQGGELFDFVFQTGKLQEKFARFYFLQLLDAFEYIHFKGISHGDVKLQNVLLDKNYNLKLADFGFSSQKATNTTFKGSGEYMAPEIYIQQGYHGTYIDIFAAGVLLFILVTQRCPFIKATSTDDYYKTIVANRYKLFWKIHQKNSKENEIKLSNSIIELLNFMLAFDPTERASLAEIREHSWGKEPPATHQEIIEEFEQRNKLIYEEDLDTNKPMPIAGVNSKVFTQYTATRDIDQEEEKLYMTEKLIKLYGPEGNSFTNFFSTSELEQLYNTLACFVDTYANTYEFSTTHYSGKFAILKDGGKIELKVTIFDVNTQGKYGIAAQFISGSKYQFNEIFKDLKLYFGGHVNTIYN